MYVTLNKNGNKLRIVLTSDGKAELQQRIDDGHLIGPDDVLYDLLEYHLCKGWEMIRPEEIGALTSAPIISDDVARNDDGDIIEIGSVYWFPNYQILSPSSELY